MENKLVTVRVVSYNAADTIVETLESIKAQTYRNIELIVSDDCSKDDTVEIARKWIEENKSRFVRTVLLTVPENTGVCANLNRALKECRGAWIKGIAADDILLPNCIEDFMEFVKNNPDSRFIASLARVYEKDFNPNNYRKTMGDCSHIVNKPINEQLNIVAFHNTIHAPTCFYNRKMLVDIGGYDERYAYEDHPLYVTMLEHGFKIYFLNKETAGYRVHTSTYNISGKLFNPSFIKYEIYFRKQRCFKYYKWRQKISLKLMWKVYDIFEKLKMNKKTRFNKFVFKIVMSFLWKFGKVQ